MILFLWLRGLTLNAFEKIQMSAGEYIETHLFFFVICQGKIIDEISY